MVPLRVLLVEDREDDALLILRELKRGGYEVEYLRVDTGAAMQRALREAAWDVIISDYSMPQFNALAALAELKQAALDLPFIIVSGTIGEDVAVAALRGGAHDFIPKGNLQRFLPALERELREAESRRRRREAERELRASTEMLAAVFNAAPLPMALLDADGVVLRWNRAAEQTFGWSAQEVRGIRAPFVSREQLADFNARLARLRAGVVVSGEEITRTRKDGAIVTLLSFAAPITDASGQVATILEVMEDITERRALEEQFRQAQKMEAVGRLAGGIAHDFNNVLTVIEGYASMALADMPAGHELQEDLIQILDATRRASGFTRQLLAFSRKQVIQREVIDLNVLVQDLSKLLERAIGENIALQLDLQPYPASVHADRSQLEQVVMNLVVNARDAIGTSGAVTLRTRELSLDESAALAAEALPAGQYWSLSVHDTGHGIPPDVLAHIFEPFFTTKESGKGTGLGLSTVYGIVTQNGGTIRVDSEPGAGTTFTVILPAVQADVSVPPREKPSVRAAPILARRPAILVVEDEAAIRTVIGRSLGRAGYEVHMAEDAESALRKIRSGDAVDLLLTDLMLPGMRGQDLALEAQRLRPAIRVVVMSGYTDDEVTTEMKFAYLAKPFAPADLLQVVADSLGAGLDRGTGAD